MNPSKIVYSRADTVPPGTPLPGDFQTLVDQLVNYFRCYMPADLMTLVSSMATPSSARTDSLHLLIGADGLPYYIRKYVTGSGWMPLQTVPATGVAFPTITGSSPSDRAFAQGLIFIRTDLQTAFWYDSVNNVFRSIGGTKNLVSVTTNYTVEASDDTILTDTAGYTITLLDPTTCSGKEINILTDASPNTTSGASTGITISGSINGTVAALLISKPWSSVKLVSNGATWVWTKERKGYLIKAVNYTLTVLDDTVQGAAGLTFTLPDPATVSGHEFVIFADATVSTGASALTVAGNYHGSTTSFTITTAWSKTTVTSNGTTWI